MVQRWQQSPPLRGSTGSARIVLDSKRRGSGSWRPARLIDLRQALADLGITDAEAQALGLLCLQGRADLASGARPAPAPSPKPVVLVVEESVASSRSSCRILYNVVTTEASLGGRQAR